MVIDRIDGFPALPKQLLDASREGKVTNKKQDEPTADRTGRRDENRPSSGDRVEISPKAHRLNALQHAMEQGRAALAEIPEVRPDRVAEVRSRLSRGFYNSVEVRSRVAERLDGLARRMEET